MKKKYPKVYAFIDSQNLNLGTLNNIYRNKKLIYKGWRLDYRKFRVYLKDKFRVTKAFLFIGYIPEYKKMYKALESYGFTLIFKPTTKDRDGKPKGNIDAELVLYSAAIEFPNFDKAIIASGDGDFRCLHEFLQSRGKLFKIIIPNALSASSLLKEFQKYKVFIGFDKEKLEK